MVFRRGHVDVDSDFERHASLGMKYLEGCSFQRHARVSGEWKTNRAGKGFSVRYSRAVNLVRRAGESCRNRTVYTLIGVRVIVIGAVVSTSRRVLC
jgi:hypothetical protein